MHELANAVAYSCEALAAMKLPGLPRSRQGWDVLVKRQKWAFREVRSKGRGGIRREYQPPPDVVAMIAAHQRGELPPAASKPGAARAMVAEAPAAPAYLAPAQLPEINATALGLILAGVLTEWGPNTDVLAAAKQAVKLYLRAVEQGLITANGIGDSGDKAA